PGADVVAPLELLLNVHPDKDAVGGSDSHRTPALGGDLVQRLRKRVPDHFLDGSEGALVVLQAEAEHREAAVVEPPVEAGVDEVAHLDAADDTLLDPHKGQLVAVD